MRRVLLPIELQEQFKGRFYFGRNEVCLNEVVLTTRELDWPSVTSAFIGFYKKWLKPAGMFFELSANNDVSCEILITDQYENNYRIVLVREKYLEHFYLGNPDGYELLQGMNQIPDVFRPKMTVYSYSTYEGVQKFDEVPQGATILDFAFHINPDMAVTAKAARIKKWMGGKVAFGNGDTPYLLKTQLEEGDVVCFDADYSINERAVIPHATVDWFAYINTERANLALIRYFNTHGIQQGSLK